MESQGVTLYNQPQLTKQGTESHSQPREDKTTKPPQPSRPTSPKNPAPQAQSQGCPEASNPLINILLGKKTPAFLGMPGPQLHLGCAGAGTAEPGLCADRSSPGLSPPHPLWQLPWGFLGINSPHRCGTAPAATRAPLFFLQRNRNCSPVFSPKVQKLLPCFFSKGTEA